VERTHVESSHIAAIGHDPDKMILEVEYKPNRHGVAAIWQFTPVDEVTFSEFFTPGASPGKLLVGIKARLGVTAYQIALVVPA
jgi:hypothetical protein